MSVNRWILPVLVIVALFGGYFMRLAFTQPTTQANFTETAGSKKIEFVVEGLKCKGTAGFFTKMYEDVQGISAIETFATEHKAVFTYDPAVITPDEIKAVMETPVPLNDGTTQQVFKCLAMQ
jgi:copper chaperone CopZ